MKYYLLYALYQLFDSRLATLAWSARVNDSQTKSNEVISILCKVLATRASIKDDLFSRELIKPLLWASKNIDAISYKASDKFSSLLMSPNSIGFQQVLRKISELNKTNNVDINKSQIIVDHQSVFNKYQDFFFELYQITKQAYSIGESGPINVALDYLPIENPIFKKGSSDVGLDVVDLIW